MSSLFPVRRGNLSHFDRDFDRIFESFFDAPLFNRKSRLNYVSSPQANVLKGDEGFTIELAAPGLSRDEFNITVENSVLTISANSEDTKEYKDKLTSQEYAYSAFSRSWTLPEGVNSEMITARYEAGILSVSLPVETSKSKKLKVEIL